MHLISLNNKKHLILLRKQSIGLCDKLKNYMEKLDEKERWGF